MRHNFVNDIGDYAKYALLRALCDGPEAIRLGVIWYLTDHLEQNNDGRKRPHLVTPGWDDLDPDLLSAMRQIESAVQSPEQLSISLIETSGILPTDTAYFSEPMPRVLGTARERAAERTAWFGRARKAVAQCDLVFLDPDNGLEVPSVPVTSPFSGKYATVGEITVLLETGSGVVLYQHGSRTAWQVQREKICTQIAVATDRRLTIRSVRFRAFGLRAFFCISSDQRMSDVISRGLDRLRHRVAGWNKSSYLVIEYDSPIPQ